MSKRLKTTPEFANEAAERAFWENNDSTAYLDWKKAQSTVLPNQRVETRMVAPARDPPLKPGKHGLNH
jgi:CopG antitoxin of type II toxin-antitoxin system